MTSEGRRVRLTVGDARLEDVGEGRARISRHLMEALDLAEGELLQVHGAHPILVRAAPSSPEDEGLDIIRLSVSERRKAGAEIGDVVDVQRHEIPVATRIRLLVIGHSGQHELTAEDLRPELAAQPLLAGDTVSVAPRRTNFDAQVSVLGLTVAEVNGSSSECGAVLARVMETLPGGIVMVSDQTEIELEISSQAPTEPDDETDEQETA